jgi:hypothetical protein
MIWLTNVLEKPAGKAAAIMLCVVAIAASGYELKNSLMSSAVSQERERIFIDSTNGKPFNHYLEKGESIPVDAPSGGKTGYPAELCYWTKDGQPKTDPTPVLLNMWIGKPGPTFCPDCGRLVVPNNPIALPGRRPPPTQEEYNRYRGITSVGPELLHSVASGSN